MSQSVLHKVQFEKTCQKLWCELIHKVLKTFQQDALHIWHEIWKDKWTLIEMIQKGIENILTKCTSRKQEGHLLELNCLLKSKYCNIKLQVVIDY